MAANESNGPLPGTDSLVQDAIERLRRGDASAKNDLLAYARGQFERMARKMLRGGTAWEKLRRWEQTDDVVQGLMMRMSTAIERIEFPSVRDFFRLAARHIRWELKSLRDRHRAAKRGKGKLLSDVQADPQGGSPVVGGFLENAPARPDSFAEFSRYLDEIDTIPDEDREILDLIILHALTLQEAADRLEISLATFNRRYRDARLRLRGELSDDPDHEASS